MTMTRREFFTSSRHAVKFAAAEHACVKIAGLPEIDSGFPPFKITTDPTHNHWATGMANTKDEVFLTILKSRPGDFKGRVQVLKLNPSNPNENPDDTNFPPPEPRSGHLASELLTDESGNLSAWVNIGRQDGNIFQGSTALYSYNGASWKKDFGFEPPLPGTGSSTETMSALKTPNGSWITITERDRANHTPLEITLTMIRNGNIVKEQPLMPSLPDKLSPRVVLATEELLTCYIAPAVTGEPGNLYFRAYSPDDLQPLNGSAFSAKVIVDGKQIFPTEIMIVFNKIRGLYEVVVKGKENSGYGPYLLASAEVPLLAKETDLQVSFRRLTEIGELPDSTYTADITTNNESGVTTITYRRRLNSHDSTVIFDFSNPYKKLQITGSRGLLHMPTITSNPVGGDVLVAGHSLPSVLDTAQIYGWPPKVYRLSFPIVNS